MSRPSSPNGGGRSSSGGGGDGWGPSTAVHGGSSRRVGRAFNDPPASARQGTAPPRDGGWSPAGPAPRDQQRANRVAERRTERSMRELEARRGPRQRIHERGLPWWAALAVLIVIAAIGGVIDTLGSIGVKGGFNIGIVVASVVAILLVKRSHMFPVVIAPPIVYSLAAVFQLYLRSDGLHDKKVVFDAAANYLVYGFPAIAAATAAVLIVAGVRLITRK